MIKTIAIVEADNEMLHAMALLVESFGFETKRYACLSEAIATYNCEAIACMVVGCDGDGEAELNQLLQVLEKQPAARMVMITNGSPTALVVRALRGGISNLLEHPFQFSALSEAVQAAVGENHELLRSERKRLPEEITQLLTRQEESIALLLVDGAATKEIAAKLGLSMRTIHYRKSTILKKIGAQNRSEASKLLVRGLNSSS